MPDGRRVQIAWGRIEPKGMPFNQMMLFPTEFKLVTTPDGVRMRATPIAEVARLHGRGRTWSSLSAADANRALKEAGVGPIDVKLNVTFEKEGELAIRYGGEVLTTIHDSELEKGRGSVEVLIDKGVAEIFVDGGARYIVRELPTSLGDKEVSDQGLELIPSKAATTFNKLEVYSMQSIWSTGNQPRDK
jgi:sucrose-6-phosphate hydrolase SacC (GH32 family)